MPFLKLSQVGLKYSEFELKDISFSLKKGERVSILGLSGSGKSSLLSLVYGLIEKENGQIQFLENDLDGPSKVLIPGHKKIKLVNQDYGLDKYHNVQENISNKILHLEREATKSRTIEILDVINLSSHKNQKAVTLSGGQKQRLSLGRALAELPELLLLDEPFSQIDFMNKFEIERKLWGYLKENDIATIMVTHDYLDAFTLSDRVLVMKDGQLLNDTNKTNLYQFPCSHYEAMITGGYNTCLINEKQINFRKNEFSLDKTNEYSLKLDIKIENRIDIGAKEIFNCATRLEETIVIESSFKFKKLKTIYLQDKKYSFEN